MITNWDRFANAIKSKSKRVREDFKSQGIFTFCFQSKLGILSPFAKCVLVIHLKRTTFDLFSILTKASSYVYYIFRKIGLIKICCFVLNSV